jgi:dethiobiotin synthetase
MKFFLAGTDTDSGKTYVTKLLLAALQSEGATAVGYKPVCSGGRADPQALLESSSPGFTLDEINPCWFTTPLSPHVASRFEGRPIALPTLIGAYQALTNKAEHLIVEGAGGWETPLCEGKTMADLAAVLALPVVLVVNNRLGALNHTLLTLRSIAAHGLTCVGIILNQPADERDPASISNRAVLEEFTSIPILAEIMHGETDYPADALPSL